MTRRGGGGAVRAVVFGVVQGVGFRPFVYRLAHRLGLRGWVQNAGFGVEVHVEGGTAAARREFLASLRDDPPPLARIERLETSPAGAQGLPGFEIRETKAAGSFVFISPDIATCPECLEEVRTPGARRFRYPFTNCTNCGPRYTIVTGLPYDRPKTTMASFPMCRDCAREYGDPLDRRHHAQPIACPACGPRVTLRDARTGTALPGGIAGAAALIRKGRILAVKGLGGFHLVCDPSNRAAVRRLRRLKSRTTKPLALMARDTATVERYARVGPAERRLLESSRRPIVLLAKKSDMPLIAPNLDEAGFMLPYTPLHHLLLERLGLIVATSSNSKDAPIMKDEAEGIRGLSDAVLSHDRPIAMRADDSVVKVVSDGPLFLRRARGYVPYPQAVPEGLRRAGALVALGGELKDTVSIYRDGYVVTSQFLGDLDDYRNAGYFEETLAHLERLFGVRPEAVITDLHPGFRTTRLAARMGIPHFRVQHHFAHVLAPMLEHGLGPEERVLGVALDGYGYGEDGSAWGGEFLLAGYRGYERLARIKPVPLAGGDLAAREPWRMALAYLHEAYGEDLPRLPVLRKVPAARRAAVLEMVRKGVRSPLTSSCGRLFDAVSFLCGTAPEAMEYEAEAAMRLEAAARGSSGRRKAYPVAVTRPAVGGPAEVSFAPLVRAVVRDIQEGLPVPRIAAAFHETLARLILRLAEGVREERRTGTVALAGGVFLNRELLERTMGYLVRAGFRVIRPSLYSPNDESLSLGQIAWGLANIRSSSLPRAGRRPGRP
jgi:hydrogenase maturation protein HypF